MKQKKYSNHNGCKLSKINDQTTDPKCSKNTKQNKYPKHHTQAYCIQAAEYQRQRENLKGANEKEQLNYERKMIHQ